MQDTLIGNVFHAVKVSQSIETEELGSDEIAEILELDVTEVERVLSEYSLTHQKENP